VRDFWLLDDARIFGGGQQTTLRLARFIGEHVPDRSARLVCPEDSVLAERGRAAGIPVVDADFPDLDALGAPRIARAVVRLRRLLEQAGEGSVVVGASLRTQVYAHAATLARRQAPPIVHLMSEQDSAGRLTARLLLRRYGAVVALGDNAALGYRRALPGMTVHAVNNFLLPEEVIGPTQAAPKPPTDRPPALGVLARLIPEKGVLELIGELAQYPDAWSRLLIGGPRQDGLHVRAIEDRLAETGLEQRVHLLGHVDDLAGFFAEVDALVVPSVGNEGQPTVILEALAHERPVIARDSIASGDFDGLPVFPYSSAHDLARTLSGLQPVPPGTRSDLLDRFGPRRLLDAIEAAAANPHS
jgi:hypothetical protein